MKKIILSILVLIVSFQLNAQSKTGTIDSEYILSKMPELTKVQGDLKTYNTKLESDLKVKVEEYQAKVKEYQEKVASFTEPMKKTKQEEIIALENDIAKFRKNGSQLIQIEQNRLLQPLYQKIGKALEEVAKAEGYTQVFTITTSGLAYVDPKYDVTKTVMQKLGITIEETPKK
ncbi:periplasmic chaperone for outer membrane proteins Skp [Aquimarina sp. MAR_2010_214]|uniref:OmpH family outer membrane protein n=1 Tax=Aquimarina sp. MAR_2010_214 TaxID=1250026 RepID=UPI000C712CBD|nr:OmpH family outer membrane protein [Aquimarina sp. MAR_2010_214]PKV50037.1 periplasmic chaperone for outer membrane proteins Skp [Aquimarina sp. MAR_2010_214]